MMKLYIQIIQVNGKMQLKKKSIICMNKVMRIVNNIPKDTTLINTRRAFTTNIMVLEKKNRLIICGSKQRKSINYTSTYHWFILFFFFFLKIF